MDMISHLADTLVIDGSVAEGRAMAEIVRNTARLTAADRHAIAVYLRSVRPVRTKKAVRAPQAGLRA